jgi:hypothetical protein
VNIETFAAARRGLMDSAFEEMRPTVAQALNQWYARPETWHNPITEAAANLWASVVADEGGTWLQAGESAFRESIGESLAQTTSPASRLRDREAQVDRITYWAVTFAINSATTFAVDQEGGDVFLEWVTMSDADVRDIHRPLHGQQVPVGETFNVAGHDLHFPGEPVGPPEVWINCRCVVRPAAADEAAVRSPNQSGEDMPPTTFGETKPAAAAFASDENLEDVDDIIGETGEGEEDVYPDDRVPFHGVLAPINKMSGDRRIFETDAITWRDGASPIPMRWVKQDVGRHDGAVRVANFDRIWIEDDEVRTEGFFFDKEEAQEVIDMLVHGALGVSVDLDEMVASLVNEDGSTFNWDEFTEGDPEPILSVSKGRIAGATIVDIPAFQEAFIALGPWPTGEAVAASAAVEEECSPCEEIAALEAEFEDHDSEEFKQAVESVLVAAGIFAPGTKDGPGWITNPKETARIRRYWTHGKGAAKIRWGQPGDFNRCRRQLAKYVKNPRWLAGTCANMHKEALGVWPGQERGKHAVEGAIMASAFTVVDPERDSLTASAPVYPRAWFEDPALEAPTPLTITEEGRIYGHVATWDVCHIGLGISVGDGDQCVTAPHSETNYALFHTGSVVTDNGTVPVGSITMGIGHAGMSLKAQAAAAHYDVTDAQVALVAAGEDQHGIWFSGALLPDVTEEQIVRLRAASLSGDWRRHGDGLEMVAALAVNVPGFPIPRTALAASGQADFALVAAAPVRQPEPAAGTIRLDVDTKAFAREVLAEMENQRRLAEFRSAFNAEVEKQRAARLEQARQAFQVK